ncbi:protein lethal(2)essential for life [Caerostris darwini]|uniref:Protein lethal(2)essential for life n=1 Tax=Caerostris darwini TaxID=1538125 RepID=A0AAV4UZ45_9ARAC|nr:protein lethal(2)essential for life [Caerostris darwini]
MFGRVLGDLYEPSGVFNTPYFIIPQSPQATVAPRRSNDKRDSNKAQVLANLKHFRPHEIDIKTIDNFVVIHAKHEERADEHGFVSREFTRRCQPPDDVEPHTVTASLSQDGVLTLQAPRKMLEPPPKNERNVPITIQLPVAVVVAQKQQQQQLQKQQQQQLQKQQQQQLQEQQQQQLQEQQQQAAQQVKKEPKQCNGLFAVFLNYFIFS